jgi:hypothetical protein
MWWFGLRSGTKPECNGHLGSVEPLSQGPREIQELQLCFLAKLATGE